MLLAFLTANVDVQSKDVNHECLSPVKRNLCTISGNSEHACEPLEKTMTSFFKELYSYSSETPHPPGA